MRTFLLLPLLLLLCLACKKEDLNREFEMRIKDSKAVCTGVGPMECLLVQQGEKIGTEEWDYFYDQIEGFTYQEGFIYHILVRKEKLENPPMDASSVRYMLVRQLSKVAVE